MSSPRSWLRVLLGVPAAERPQAIIEDPSLLDAALEEVEQWMRDFREDYDLLVRASEEQKATLRAETTRLRAAIEGAPHAETCPKWSKRSVGECSCWKASALKGGAADGR